VQGQPAALPFFCAETDTMTASADAPPQVPAMVASLTALLDRVSGSRQVLPHLAALEASLRQHGVACLDQAKLPVLQKICSQMASLPLPAEDRPLLALQDLLLARLRPPEPPAAPVAPPAAPSPRRASAPLPSSMSVDQVVVVEMTHSAFMEATQDQRNA
jgi:hypothetical protein